MTYSELIKNPVDESKLFLLSRLSSKYSWIVIRAVALTLQRRDRTAYKDISWILRHADVKLNHIMHGVHFHVANQTANIWGWKEWRNWKKLLYILIFRWFLSFAFAGVCCRELQHHSHSPKFEAATSTETSTHRDVHDLQTFCVPPWRLSPSGAHRIATVDASTLSSRYTFDTVTDKTETVQITDWSREAPRMSWSVFLEPDLELKINASPHRPKFINQSLISLPRVDALQVVPSMHRRGWPGWIVTGAVQRSVVAVSLVGSHCSHKPCIEMLQLNRACHWV